jgi:hypothetical protein
MGDSILANATFRLGLIIMTTQEWFVFLNAKRLLMMPFLRGDSALNYEMMFSRLEAHLDKIPDAGWREMDKSLERSIAEEISSGDEAQIRSELRKRLGLASFGEEPRTVLQRIERTGKISNDDEARLVNDLIAGSYLGWAEGAGKTRRLSEILHAYERSS